MTQIIKLWLLPGLREISADAVLGEKYEKGRRKERNDTQEKSGRGKMKKN
jgi:hypothetical protein